MKSPLTSAVLSSISASCPVPLLSTAWNNGQSEGFPEPGGGNEERCGGEVWGACWKGGFADPSGGYDVWLSGGDRAGGW